LSFCFFASTGESESEESLTFGFDLVADLFLFSPLFLASESLSEASEEDFSDAEDFDDFSDEEDF